MTGAISGARPAAGRDPYLFLVVAAILTLGALLAWQAVTRAHRCGYARDDAIYLQTAWNTAHGRLWRYSLESDSGPEEACHLASHADLTHPLYAPALWIADGPETILVLQPLLVLLGAVPLFVLARRRLGSSALAAAVAGVFLLYVPLVGNAIQIVGVLLAVPLLLLALERMDAGKLRIAGVCFALAVGTREDVALPVAAFLLTFAGDRERRRWALGIGGGALAWLFLYTATKGALFGVGPDHLARYSALGGSLGEIALSPLRHPIVFFGTLLAPTSWRLLWLLLVPLGLLPLLSPRHVFAAAAPIALVALSAVETDRILGRYLIAGIPFLFVGVVRALAWLEGRLPKNRTVVPATLLLACGLTALSWTCDSLGFGAYSNLRILGLDGPSTLLRLTPEARAVREQLVASIPPEASVSASAPWLIVLAQRRHLHPFPVRARESDFLLIDRRVFFNPWPPRTAAEHQRAIDEALAEPGVTVTTLEHFLLVKRPAR